MRLELNGLEVDCVIGERPDERTRDQRLRVDVALEIPDTAAETDELGDTVDYAGLAEAVRTALVAARCRMIERAAKVVSDVCRADGRIRGVAVRITKAGALPRLESASVTYEDGLPFRGRGGSPRQDGGESR